MLAVGVSVGSDEQKIADLKRANVELTESLARCRELLQECRSKLSDTNKDDAVLGSKRADS
jgi:hypothetical protein